jgi:hypothetical protein
MIYLVVGLDRNTFAPWHENIHAVDASAATTVARDHASIRGINLVVAAVIGPSSNVLSVRPAVRATPRAA